MILAQVASGVDAIKVATGASSDCQVYTGIAVALVLIWLMNAVVNSLHVDGGKLDAAAKALLERSSTVSATFAAQDDGLDYSVGTTIATALENAPMTLEEGDCAAQMKSILAQGLLQYSTLVDSPQILLRVSPACANRNPALWTRFTVQYNLYAGSIVALGTDEQRQKLIDSQSSGALGCFAFTEKAAGVMSGAAMEATARYDAKADEFVIDSPTKGSAKNWISQGMYAENAVILAELFIGDTSYGPHLFWSPIATPAGTKSKSRTGSNTALRPVPLKGVTVESLPAKNALVSLDNAAITFDNFRVPASALLSRFGGLDDSGNYVPNLPKGCSRMLDLLISRLLTGRIVLAEATLSYSLSRLRRNWAYCQQRTLWKHPKSSKPQKTMADMPLVRATFRDYAVTVDIISTFVAHTRERVAQAILNQVFTNDLIEATCMCKFLGTGFGVDAMSACRKAMGARALQADSWLGGEESFMPNATCAAEGDNTIMELKIVQDIVRGRTSKVPLGLMWRICGDTRGRSATTAYLTFFARAMLLGKKALQDGQLLKDIANARAHMRVIDVWLQSKKSTLPGAGRWLSSYDDVILNFPTRLQA